MKKIAFFDIDGTLSSEIDGSIPDSAVLAIRTARANGNLTFINTGRCFQNIEERFREIGFDGYVCGCGTNIYSQGEELFYQTQTHDVIMKILDIARKTDVDIIFESKEEVVTDTTRSFKHPGIIEQYQIYIQRHYDMSHSVDSDDFTCDKFCIWYTNDQQLETFRKVSDEYFQYIDRNDGFAEFVPLGYSKATGIEFLLNYYNINKLNAYVFGDSNNDIPMLSYVPNSIVMGNAKPESLKEFASYVTDTAANNGIQKALEHFSFI